MLLKLKKQLGQAVNNYIKLSIKPVNIEDYAIK